MTKNEDTQDMMTAADRLRAMAAERAEAARAATWAATLAEAVTLFATGDVDAALQLVGEDRADDLLAAVESAELDKVAEVAPSGQWVTAENAGTIIGYSAKTVKRWIADGTIPADAVRRTGKAGRYMVDAVKVAKVAEALNG